MSDHESLTNLYRKYENKDAQHVDQDEVFTDLERHASRIWETAREADMDGVLKKEDAPKPTTLRTEYASVVFDDEGMFDLYGFKTVFNQLEGADRLVDDLAAGF